MDQMTTIHTTGGDRQRNTPGRPLTLAEVAELPAVVDLMTAARALRIGRTKAYELARRDQFLCRLIRIGDLYRLPTAELRRLLGAEQPPPTAAQSRIVSSHSRQS
jgi:hypothetical protein